MAGRIRSSRLPVNSSRGLEMYKGKAGEDEEMVF